MLKLFSGELLGERYITPTIKVSEPHTTTAHHKLSLKLKSGIFSKEAWKEDFTYVTGPAKIGHIYTQYLALFLNFNLQYLLKYKSYDHKLFMPYSQINRKAHKVYRT